MVTEETDNQLQSLCKSRPKTLAAENLVFREKDFSSETVSDGNDQAVLKLDRLLLQSFLELKFVSKNVSVFNLLFSTQAVLLLRENKFTCRSVTALLKLSHSRLAATHAYKPATFSRISSRVLFRNPFNQDKRPE